MMLDENYHMTSNDQGDLEGGGGAMVCEFCGLQHYMESLTMNVWTTPIN